MSRSSTAGGMLTSLPGELQAQHELAHLDQRAITMTGPVLFGKRHFRKGTAGGAIDEHGIVSEAIGTARQRGNRTWKQTVCNQMIDDGSLPVTGLHPRSIPRCETKY